MGHLVAITAVLVCNPNSTFNPNTNASSNSNSNPNPNRLVGVMVRASASESVDLKFIAQVESYQKTSKKWYSQFPCLTLST